jgi:hypothetical protein
MAEHEQRFQIVKGGAPSTFDQGTDDRPEQLLAGRSSNSGNSSDLTVAAWSEPCQHSNANQHNALRSR